MSQVIAGCCCTPAPPQTCTLPCNDPNITPPRIFVQVGHLRIGPGITEDKCINPLVAYPMPISQIELALCARSKNGTRSWQYVGTPIKVATQYGSWTCGFDFGLCRSVDTYLVASVQQDCGVSGAANEFNHWSLYINTIQQWKADPVGCGVGRFGCDMRPKDLLSNPCQVPYSYAVGGTDVRDLFDGLAACQPLLGIGSWLLDPGAPPDLSDGRFGPVFGVHSRWAYDPTPTPNCDPRGQYLYTRGDPAEGWPIETITVTG
jgi:hypothetical protein